MTCGIRYPFVTLVRAFYFFELKDMLYLRIESAESFSLWLLFSGDVFCVLRERDGWRKL